MTLFPVLCTVLLLALPAAAAPQQAPVPDLGFSQKVTIVVAAKKDPRLLDMKIEQKQAVIQMDLIVDQNVDRQQAKQISHDVVMLAKSLSLDDHPKTKDKPGRGLYSYHVSVARPDGVMLLTALKKKKQENLSFEDRFPAPKPLTRADVNGR